MGGSLSSSFSLYSSRTGIWLPNLNPQLFIYTSFKNHIRNLCIIQLSFTFFWINFYVLHFWEEETEKDMSWLKNYTITTVLHLLTKRSDPKCCYIWEKKIALLIWILTISIFLKRNFLLNSAKNLTQIVIWKRENY